MSNTETQFNGLSEPVAPDFVDIDSVNQADFWPGSGHIGRLLIQGNAPAIILERNEKVPDYAISDDIGARVLSAAMYEYGTRKMDRDQESVRFRPTDTPRHLDGVGTQPFFQIHTNLGAVRSEVLFYVQSLVHDQQNELVSSSIKNADRHTVTLFDSMPTSVKMAPAVAAYRAKLEAGQTIVFKNGFNILGTGEDAELVTHKFSSIDENGQPLDSPRDTAVGTVFFTKRASRHRGKVFGARLR